MVLEPLKSNVCPPFCSRGNKKERGSGPTRVPVEWRNRDLGRCRTGLADLVPFPLDGNRPGSLPVIRHPDADAVAGDAWPRVRNVLLRKVTGSNLFPLESPSWHWLVP